MEKMTIPLVGTGVVHTGRDDSPQVAEPEPVTQVTGYTDQRIRPRTDGNENSIHRVRLGARIARSMERAERAEAAANEPATTQSPAPSQPTADYTAMQAEIASLRQQVAGFTQSPQGGQAPANQEEIWFPDPERFDFYNPDDVAEFHRMNTEAVEKTAQQRLAADRAQRQKEADDARWRSEGEALKARYGKDANFDETIAAAAELIIDSGYKLSAQEAYERASALENAKAGRRGGNLHLRRETLKNGQKKPLGLGQIWAQNQETGRASNRRGR